MNSFIQPTVYILTLNSKRITDEYINDKYLCHLYPKYEYVLNKETGERERICTKRLDIWKEELEFGKDRWNIGKTIYSLKDKTAFCIAEFGDQYKLGRSYIEEINLIFKDIININKNKYDILDVSEGIYLPTDRFWEKNTGEKKAYTGYMVPNLKGILTGWMKDNDISIRDFLENPRYILFMDSEYNSIMNELYENEMISDNIIEIYSV